MYTTNIISQLVEALSKPLPGAKAHNKMSPIANLSRYSKLSKNYKVASVLALVHTKGDHLYLTFIERASVHKGDKHAGQIGFPGGKYEIDDIDYLQCALRETFEEIGIDKNKIQILGNLTPIYVFASDFLVHPFIGYTTQNPQYLLQESEVASVIEIKLSELFAPENKTNSEVVLGKGIAKNVVGYKLKNHFLWGATAMMTSEIEFVFNDILNKMNKL
ncbi:MAG: CoA pyrophosphatase [Saprospiraceae bacterium]